MNICNGYTCRKCYKCNIHNFKSKYEDECRKAAYAGADNASLQNDALDPNEMDWETEQSVFLRNIEKQIISYSDQFRGPAVESSQKTNRYHNSDFLLDNDFEEQHGQPIKQVDQFSIRSDTSSPVLMTQQPSSQEDKELSSNHHHAVTKARMVHWKPNVVTPAKLTKNDNNRRNETRYEEEDIQDKRLLASDKHQVISLQDKRVVFLEVEHDANIDRERIYPPIIKASETCQYCKYVGSNCRRAMYGMFCCGIVYRDFKSSTDMTAYTLADADKKFSQAYMYLTDIKHYILNKKQSVRSAPLTKIPKCLEVNDLLYIVHLIEFEKSRMNQRAVKTESQGKSEKEEI